ncbi:MAG: acyl-CoA dehydrogenase family protein [Isosphaeraceae bacterium]|nr:acyl-CoA dehydrogenase family protein [Isosphaeraceae bacterium]
MDFDFTPSQKHWHDAAVEFARAHLDDDVLERDENREFWREGWQRCGQFGIQGLPIPEEFGGKGQGLPETIAAMEGLGYACADNGLIFAMNASMWTNNIPILLFGTDEQKRRWLPGLCNGSLVGANGASEVGAGSDIFSMKSTAERVDGGWVLNGRKTWVTSGPIADVYVCYMKTDPTKQALGISAFIVPKDTPGFRVVREIRKLGVRTVPMGELAFEDCRLPADAMLGREAPGAEIFACSMEWERGAILAGALGAMRRQLERCIKHARTREQFGQPIGKFQAVAHRIVGMKVRLESCRPLVYRIGRLKAEGKNAMTEAAIAKLHVSDCYIKNSLDAVEIFGAMGFASEFGVEKELRDSVGSLIYSGTNDIMRNLIAKSLGL